MSTVARHARIGTLQATVLLNDAGEATVKSAVANDAGRAMGEIRGKTSHPSQLYDLAAALTTIGRLQEKRQERDRAAEAAKVDRKELEPDG